MPATPSTLDTAFDPRRNGLSAMRLALAAVVAVTHALELSAGWQPTLGRTLVGSLAVDAFFVLSGYLVTGSLLRLTSVRRYAWHRALRILPGFWACLLLTAFVVAPLLALLSGRPPAGVFAGGASALTYLYRDAFLLMRQFDIGGFGPAVPGEGVVNGSLWTLCYEAVCYGVVAVLGLVGLLTRRRWTVLAATGAVQLATILQALGVIAVPQDRLLRLAFLFLLGSCALLYADRIRLTLPIGIVAAVTVVVSIAVLPDYRALGAVGFAYLLLALAARPPFAWQPRSDLSYGLYVYHWPVALLLITATGGRLAPAAVVALVLVAGLAVAAVSWRFVEAPALRWKSAPWVTAPLRPPHRRRAAVLPSARP